MHAIFTAFAVASLFTAVFALKFRYWGRPKLLACYWALFAGLEWVLHAHFIPPDAFGDWLGILCSALTVPVVIAIILLHRHEQRKGRTQG